MSTRVYTEVDPMDKSELEEEVTKMNSTQEKVVRTMIQMCLENKQQWREFHINATDPNLDLSNEEPVFEENQDLNEGARAKNADDLPPGVDSEFHIEQQDEFTLEDLDDDIDSLGE